MHLHASLNIGQKRVHKGEAQVSFSHSKIVSYHSIAMVDILDSQEYGPHNLDLTSII